MNDRYIAAIDLGSSGISLGVALIQGDNTQIIYFDKVESQGIRTGEIFNPSKCSKAIRSLLDKAKAELGINIHQIVTNYPRYGIEQQIAKGELPRTDPESSITEEELDSLKNVSLDSYPLEDSDRQLIYGAIVQSFATEDYINARESDVVGMISKELYGYYKMFIGNKRTSNYIDVACNMADIAISDKYFAPACEGNAVLTADEMENGVALINFGAGVTSVSIFQKGVMRYYGAIPFGGKSITDDIRYETGFSEHLAENIKLAFGACLPDKLLNLGDKILQVDTGEDFQPKVLPVKYLSEIINARESEIVNAMLWHIQKSGLADSLRSGLVITGGGARLANCNNLIKELSGYTVRTGQPRRFFTTTCENALSPDATTCIGLILEAKKHSFINCAEIPETEEVEVVLPAKDELFPEEVAATDTAAPQKDADEGKKQKVKKVKPPKPEKAHTEIKLPTWIKKISDFQGNLFDGMDGNDNINE